MHGSALNAHRSTNNNSNNNNTNNYNNNNNKRFTLHRNGMSFVWNR
jgi:hypothetical protein